MKFNQNFIMPRVNVSEDEIKNAYNRTQREFASNPKRRLEALSVQMAPDITDEDKAALMATLTQVAEDVNAGKLEWSEAIETHDSGVYKERKGQMGTFQEGELIEELKPVFEIEVNQVSTPLVVANSLMLIRVAGIEDGNVKPLAEVKEQLRNQLFQAEMAEELEQWVQSERRRASVRVLLAETKP